MHCTLKEQVLWVRRFHDLEELRVALIPRSL
jgi:hypothetical protein